MIEHNHKILQWMCIDICNLKCKTCNIWQKKNSEAFSTQEVFTMLKKLPNSIEHIDITGGEPFMRNDMQQVLNYLQTTDLNKISITTNASYKNQTIKTLNELDVKIPTTICMSIDGMEEMNKYVRGANTFKSAEQILNAVNRDDIKFKISYTINEFNHKEFPKVQQHFKEKYGIEIRAINLPVVSEYYDNTEQQFNITEEMIKDYEGIDRFEDVMHFVRNKEHDKTCSSLEHKITLAANGDIKPCSVLWQYNIGNIRNHNYDIEKTLDNSRVYENLLKQTSECKMCFSPCEYSVWFKYGGEK